MNIWNKTIKYYYIYINLESKKKKVYIYIKRYLIK